MTQDDIRTILDRASTHMEEWHGFPVPLADLPVTLHDRHPLREGYRKIEATMNTYEEIEIVVGGPEVTDEPEVIRNHWWSKKLNADVWVYQQGDKVFGIKQYRSPDRSMERLNFWLNTIGTADAWTLAAEAKARKKLRDLLTPRQWHHYYLTGSFLETSERSRLTYIFRRLRPTVAMSPRNKPGGPDTMRCLAVLCMHPIGYYQQSWGGCLVPTDDVIAHLISMRADEARYWGQCNQHQPSEPEAGL